MERKKLIYLFMTIGSLLGGYLPTLWDASMFSLSSVLLTAVGGFTGIWFGYTLSA